MKKTRKVVSTLVAMSLVGGILLPAAGPAFAYSKNSVSKVISIQNDNEYHQIGNITIREDKDYNNDFQPGDVFVLTLPSGVEFDRDSEINAIWKNDTENGTVDIRYITDSKIEVTMPSTVEDGKNDQIILQNVRIKAKSSVNGDIKIKIDGKDSAVTSQELLIARAFDGDAVVTVDEVETIGESGKGGTITIEEAAVGSMNDDNEQEITIKLPSKFDWDEAEMVDNADENIKFLGGFDGINPTNVSIEGRTLKIKFDSADRGRDDLRGYIEIDPYIVADNDAKYGDVEVTVDGDNVDSTDVVIAKYADFGVEASVKKVEEFIAGRMDEETEEITLEENVKNTLVAGRKLTLTLPTWVKVTEVNFTKGDDYVEVSEIDDNEVTLKVTNEELDDTKEIKFKLTMSIEANKSGDIEMAIGGKAGAEGKLVVAKAVAPVTIEAAKSPVKVGVKSQAIGDIVITETKAGAIADENDYDDSDGKTELRVKLTDGVEWNDYKVEVIEGNLELDDDNIDTADGDDSVLIIPIKNESSKASKIKISGITVDLTRNIPEGEVKAEVKGSAIVHNDKAMIGYDEDGGDSSLDKGEFNTSTAAKAVAAVVVTPAPEAGTAMFEIGSSIYTAGGVTKVMDAAPYIKNGRTYVPVRYLAYALGVSENDVAYENGVVTLKKGNDTIKLTIGSTTLLKNDAATTMDVAPEVTNGRTMLPARFVAEALGANVGYANGKVVISY
ncbi:copper amine oxidase N-terminal domain-containing protein [Desulforamulus hydrothermalis]|uniref:Copper amine oxidase domain protein n=1 Tax=Desulforamulus hydrothermalis Lam5 = DSM 18033 TaxID=1121428 RepID=K8EA32_9FIRM|nr:copper amine oxidase N-terminal domain-containing protein [Desulforamulus hydrothermalis]CCO08443.1 Copper amine oxidase domain protein [Desulforamulus hydrothermalis Lam5 = DSM 18033]SHH15536.1 Copper amine oxidase N-terminal domain-containing protein [Desulforamulus hydrothermalis Lam5 = DSM 18033]